VVGLFRGRLPRGVGDWYGGLCHGPEQRGPLLDVDVVFNEAAGWRLLSGGGGGCRRRKADLHRAVQLLCSKSAAMSLILLLWLAFSAAAFRVALEIGMEDSVMDLNSAALSLTLTSSSMRPVGGDS